MTSVWIHREKGSLKTGFSRVLLYRVDPIISRHWAAFVDSDLEVLIRLTEQCHRLNLLN